MSRLPATVPGERVYAIGDVHGCFDLLEPLVARIRADDAARMPCRTTIVLIGDIVDRGPRSADVVRLLMPLAPRTDRLVVLKGNHEDMMVHALRGDLVVLQTWIRLGGDATLRSWGVPTDALDLPPRDLLKTARSKIGGKTLAWLDALPLSYRSGDFFFVHAGIRPGVSLAKQDPDDLIWIRDEFLANDETHPAVIVHGHTIAADGPELRHNRIGLDTGAYRTGKLSAVGLEGEDRWTLTT
ncbi:MAG: Serine/threonine protein phosphatase [uncultured Sphingomonadaceae bacterium]|uniref:Serine/threonine protein phosphatase n=1 Tax=uncultured Sphingomonadaceae bacterium TaxID=169976 RepID=A0A6J4U4Q6_9SPHN|nr:MAG: Serine/threonine protein phosphatase [uncultured Sphingomonadaceae bacterium]